MPLSEELRREWERQERAGEWKAAPGDALYGCTFEPAGFRSYSLAAETGSWRLVLSRVDVNEREPKALVTVFADGHDAAFPDLDGLVLHRTIGLYGGTNARSLTVELAKRLGPDGREDVWARRLDYAIARTVREVQATTTGVTEFTGTLERPRPAGYVFDRRWRIGRTLSLFGPGSGGKTTLSDGLAVSLTAGVEIVPGWEPTGAFRLGVLDWDEGREEAATRLYAITRGHKVTLGSYFHRRMSRPLADAADELGRWVAGEGLEVLIVSPVNRALRQSSGDPGGPVIELHEVIREFGVSALLIDHVVGSAIEADRRANRAYGSVQKTDAVRGSYSLYPQSEEPGRRVVVLRQTKPDAMAPRQPEQAVAITYSPSWPDDDGQYDTIRFDPADVDTPLGMAEPRPEKLVRVLREHGSDGFLETPQLCALTGFHAEHVKDVARRARERGHEITAEKRDGRAGWLLHE